MLTAERVRELFTYDPAGHLRWRCAAGRWDRYAAGSIAGWLDTSTGYWYVEIDGRKYRLHRLVWLHQKGAWPTVDLDHRDLNKLNNSIENLREVTDLENAKNKPLQQNNQLRVKGVVYRERYKFNPYEVRVHANGKLAFYKCFPTLEAAIAARATAVERLHGPYGRLA